MTRLVLRVRTGSGWTVWRSWPVAAEHAGTVQDQVSALLPAGLRGRARYDVESVSDCPAPVLAGVAS